MKPWNHWHQESYETMKPLTPRNLWNHWHHETYETMKPLTPRDLWNHETTDTTKAWNPWHHETYETIDTAKPMRPWNHWHHETYIPWPHDTPIIWHRHWRILISINSCTVTPSCNPYLRSNIIKNLFCLFFISWFYRCVISKSVWYARHFEYSCKRCWLNDWQ